MSSDRVQDIALTREARAIVERAGQIAAGRGSPEANSTDALRATLELYPKLTAGVVVASNGNIDGDLPMRRLLVNASREAQSMGYDEVGPPHLVLAMLYSDSPSTAAPLQKAGLTLYNVRQSLQSRANNNRRPRSLIRGAFGISPIFLGIVATAGVAGALLWRGPAPRLVIPLTVIFVVAGWITSLCIHEFGHAFVAYLGGDRSVASAGYLTLNPLRYGAVAQSIVIPVAFLLLGGIALPGGAVYVNDAALRSRGWSSAVSLAGPIGTVLCWLLVAGAYSLAVGRVAVTEANVPFFAALAVLGFFLAAATVLNLLPVPGLDGYGIIHPWLPPSLRGAAARYGSIAIFGVYAALWFVQPVRDIFFQLVFQITAAGNIPEWLVGVGLSDMRFY
jgi:Zn-dependent protease